MNNEVERLLKKISIYDERLIDVEQTTKTGM